MWYGKFRGWASRAMLILWSHGLLTVELVVSLVQTPPSMCLRSLDPRKISQLTDHYCHYITHDACLGRSVAQTRPGLRREWTRLTRL